MARAPKTFRARFELPAGTEHYVDPVDDIERDDGEAMTEEELSSLVDGQINDARTYESSDLTQLREKALKYFEGDISADVPAATGRSSVVSKDVADVHGLIMPGLMRVFLATDNIAIYNPVLPSDEKFARQVTDYVNHVVMKECGGYIQFRSAFHDGLLMGNGVIKHWWDDTPQYSTESFTGLSEDAYTMLVMDPEVEVLEHDEYDDPDYVPPVAPLPVPPMGGMMGAPQMGMPNQLPGGEPMDMLGAPGDMGAMPEPQPPPKLHDCKVKRCTSKGRLRMAALAPEDLLLGRGTLVLDEEHVRFAAHRWTKTRSALIKEGHPKDVIYDLPAYTGINLDSPEALARDHHRLYDGDDSADKSIELIEGYDCYLQCDYDGDGVAEWRQVVTAGTTGKRAILDNEEWGDDLPFSDIVPNPVPHRWRGRSLFDDIEDIQRIKSVLMRQTLDNIYMTNTPRQKALLNGIANPEVLQDWEIGSTVWMNQIDAVTFDAVPFTADKSFPILEYLDQTIEKRTGISRSTMALDMEALSEQTATAVNANQAAAHTKVEEYARNIAEHGGLKRIFSKCLKLIVKHQDRARTVRLRDGWVEVDPRAWNAEMDVTINTGLGSGSRERDLTMLMGIAAKQEAVVMQLGASNQVLGIDKLFDTYRLMVEAAGLKPADRFFPEIKPEIMQQLQQAAAQKVDPKVQAAQMQAQADMQLAQLKAQSDGQTAQLEAQFEAQKMQKQFEFDSQHAQLKLGMEQQAQQFEHQIEIAKAQRDAELQQIQLERQAEVEERQAQADIAVKQAELQAKVRLEQMKFEFEQKQATLEFEFDKKLKLLDMYVKSKIAAAKPTPEGGSGGGGGGSVDLNIDIDSLLADEGMELPEQSPVYQPLRHIGDSQNQLAQALAGLNEHVARGNESVQQLALGHANQSNALAEALAGLSRPRRITRDENNRITGSEPI